MVTETITPVELFTSSASMVLIVADNVTSPDIALVSFASNVLMDTVLVTVADKELISPSSMVPIVPVFVAIPEKVHPVLFPPSTQPLDVNADQVDVGEPIMSCTVV